MKNGIGPVAAHVRVTGSKSSAEDNEIPLQAEPLGVNCPPPAARIRPPAIVLAEALSRAVMSDAVVDHDRTSTSGWGTIALSHETSIEQDAEPGGVTARPHGAAGLVS